MGADETRERFNAKFPKGTEFKFKDDQLIGIYTAEKPSFDKYREIKFEYQESLGNGSKSVKLESFLLFEEIESLCLKLFGGDAS